MVGNSLFNSPCSGKFSNTKTKSDWIDFMIYFGVITNKFLSKICFLIVF